MTIPQTYRLVKLRTTTVDNLKRLMAQLGKTSLEEMLTTMIQITGNHYQRLKETDWDTPVQSRQAAK